MSVPPVYKGHMASVGLFSEIAQRQLGDVDTDQVADRRHFAELGVGLYAGPEPFAACVPGFLYDKLPTDMVAWVFPYYSKPNTISYLALRDLDDPTRRHFVYSRFTDSASRHGIFGDSRLRKPKLHLKVYQDELLTLPNPVAVSVQKFSKATALRLKKCTSELRFYGDDPTWQQDMAKFLQFDFRVSVNDVDMLEHIIERISASLADSDQVLNTTRLIKGYFPSLSERQRRAVSSAMSHRFGIDLTRFTSNTYRRFYDEGELHTRIRQELSKKIRQVCLKDQILVVTDTYGREMKLPINPLLVGGYVCDLFTVELDTLEWVYNFNTSLPKSLTDRHGSDRASLNAELEQIITSILCRRAVSESWTR